MHLISLGSSFAAGPGIDPVVSRQAGRSGNNYSAILARHLGCDTHTDLSYSGATLLDVFRTDGPSQIASIPDIDPDEEVIVTLTAGGNDIGYVGRISMDSAGAARFLEILSCDGQRRAVLDAERLTEEDLVARFQQALRAIRKQIPQARIVLVGYLTLLGDHAIPSGDVPLALHQIERGRRRADLLQRAYRQAAREERCEFCDISALSKDHGVGSPDPWVTGAVQTNAWWFWRSCSQAVGWHPNRAGMEAVAKILADRLISDDLRVKSRRMGGIR